MSSEMSSKDVLKIILEYNGNNSNATTFHQWFLKQFEGTDKIKHGYCLEKFAEYFLNCLRQNTERHLKVPSDSEKPKCQTPVRTIQQSVAATSQDDSGATPRRLMLDLHLQDTSTPNKSVLTKEDSYNSAALRNETSQTSFGGASDIDSLTMSTRRLSTSVDRSNNSQKLNTSTPIRRSNVSNKSRRLSTTPTSSVSLGDFLTVNKSNNRLNKKKNSSCTLVNPNTSGQDQEKPKKRVQPISVSKKLEKSSGNLSSVFGGESSFSNENNILKISHTEVENKEQCSILAARKILKTNASEITKELTESPIKSKTVISSSTPTKQVADSNETKDELLLNFEDLENNEFLHRLADIYGILLDLHLFPNILNELSFLLNLLNAATQSPSDESLNKDFEALQLENNETSCKNFGCLKDPKYATYFSIICLNKQKNLLASLDSKTLNVIINNGNFCYLKESVRTFLLETYQKKQQILADNNLHDTSFCFVDNKICGKVYFQQERDSRQNFSSNFEFANFRIQRDLFFKCLKIWENHHLKPSWNFAKEIGPVMLDIFQQSEGFINMAHFALLFVSQLLLSASNASSPEEIGLDVDMQKLSRLTQRLIAPSQFSVDYQFPHAQAFFRDFIVNARSLAFAEQLKMKLYSELKALNDSSFELISITKTDNETYNHDNSFISNFSNDQVAVRPENLNSMLILAKFLGFTISLPYEFNATNGNGNTVPTTVEKRQIALRTFIQPNFDLYSVVQIAIVEGKLLITIPWIVQYISMLDRITLQMEVHTKVLRLLFALHWYLAKEGATVLMSTTIKFIITSCLGWLFDSNQIITEQFYSFRLMHTRNGKESQEGGELLEINKQFEKFKQVKASPSYSAEIEFNPILEALLPVACPFLGEFRVSIMPAKYASTKYASRSGRYRHITTKISENPLKEEPPATQKNLIQAFFHSQNSSTRQMITFCSERCYKSVVRDGQLKILLPSKSKADAKVNKITSNKFQEVLNELNIIYKEARREAFDKWNAMIPKMLEKRIRTALDSLLPEETASILKKTYFMVIKNNSKQKINQWFHANIIRDNYFCVDLETVANKICLSDKTKEASDLKIVTNTPSLSELLSSLQYWLHCTSVRLDLFVDTQPIVELFQQLNASFKNVLPIVLHRLLALYTIQMLHNILIYKTNFLTDELMQTAFQLLMTINKKLNTNTNKEKEDSKQSSIYDTVVSIFLLKSLGTRTECYSRYGEMIISMIKYGLFSMSYTNQLFVSILKYDWSSAQLNEISNMLRQISQATSGISSPKSYSYEEDNNDQEDESAENDEKSNLFMDMLADLSRDVDLY